MGLNIYIRLHLHGKEKTKFTGLCLFQIHADMFCDTYLDMLVLSRW